jgi:RNA polymerase sigma-70 factor (sigma-E family)
MPKEQEFEEFALARTPHLYRAAWLLCADAHRAEDLVQETLAKVYVRWTRTLGRPIDNPAAYAQTTLVRTFISARRRRSEHERPMERLPENGAGADLGDPDLRLALAGALAALEPIDRAVLVLRFLDDASVADTAAQLSISPGAVRNRTMRALERLRTQLGTSLPDLLHS